MKLVPLTKGKFAMVDDEDYERVTQFKWQYNVLRKGTGPECAKRTIRSNGRRITLLMHRFILPHDMPATDHADGNGLNNQKNNLRPCTDVENGRNRKLQKHSAPYKGVHYFARAKKWTASVQINGKQVHLGSFDNPESAALAYDHAAIKYYGQFARTNQQLGLL